MARPPARPVAHQLAATGDPVLQELLDELQRYPAPPAEVLTAAPVVPIRLRTPGGRELAFVSTTTLFGTPGDVTVSELAIEAFLPADEPTARALGASRSRQARRLRSKPTVSSRGIA